MAGIHLCFILAGSLTAQGPTIWKDVVKVTEVR